MERQRYTLCIAQHTLTACLHWDLNLPLVLLEPRGNLQKPVIICLRISQRGPEWWTRQKGSARPLECLQSSSRVPQSRNSFKSQAALDEASGPKGGMSLRESPCVGRGGGGAGMQAAGWTSIKPQSSLQAELKVFGI